MEFELDDDHPVYVKHRVSFNSLLTTSNFSSDLLRAL